MKKKIHTHIHSQRQNGFTLIEFMIAMAMSLFCVLAMTGIYLRKSCKTPNAVC